MEDIEKMRLMWDKRSKEGQRLRDEEAKRLIRDGVVPTKVGARMRKIWRIAPSDARILELAEEVREEIGGRLAKVLDGSMPRRPSEVKDAPFEVRVLSELQSLRRMVGVVDGRMLTLRLELMTLRLEIKRIADALGCPDSLAHVRAAKVADAAGSHREDDTAYLTSQDPPVPDEPREEQDPNAPPEARPTPSVG